MTDTETIPQRLHRRLSEAKARGASEAEIQQELAWAQEAINAKSAADPERQRTALDTIGAGAQTFADASTLGLSGLADDAVSAALGPSTFKGNREARRESKGEFAEAHPGVALGLEVAGSMVMPMGELGAAAKGLKAARTLGEAREGLNLAKAGGALVHAAPTAGRLGRMGASMADAGLQAGAAGTINNLDEASASGVGNALRQGAKTAALGAGIAAPLAGMTGLVSRAAGRMEGLAKLDKSAFKAKDTMNALDKVNYGNALGQVGEPLSTEMRRVLNHPDIAPTVNKLQQMEQWKGVPINDPKFLDAVYKDALSDWGKQIETHSMTADPSKPNLTRSMKEHVGLLKGQFLDAMDTQVPGYSNAVKTHATQQGEINALVQGADVGRNIGSGKAIPGKKLLSESHEAFMRKIPDMTPDEAEMALYGVLGRGREAVHITSSPLGAFGLLSSGVRLPMQMYRTGPIVAALEKQAGRKYADKAMADLVRGTMARTIGAESGKP